MQNQKINLKSKRAIRARLSIKLNKKIINISLWISIVLLILVGLLLLIIGMSLGWMVFIPAVYLYMFATWIKGDLGNASFGSEKSDIGQLLEFETLGKLSNSTPSLHELWQAIDGSEDVYFLANRFLIDKAFFDNFLDRTENSASTIWTMAENLRQKYYMKGYSNTLLLICLTLTVPGIDQVLKSIELDINDLESGIPWMRDIKEKRQIALSKKFMGGVGRDWAFGYTPLLNNFGYNISQDIERHGYFKDTSMHKQIVDQMISIMNNGSANCALIGDPGVGKTTCVYSFAEYLLTSASAPPGILHSQIIQLDAPSILSNASKPGQLEEIMIRILNEAHSAKNIILFFDDAEVFFGYGASSIDISHIIAPALESSSIKLIFAMKPSAWQGLSNSVIGSKMQSINVNPSDEFNTLAVLRDSVSTTEYKNKCVFSYSALKEGYKLGSRYATNSAMPGASLSLLEQVATIIGKGLITKTEVQAGVEQIYGIKLQASGPQETNKLLNLEQELHKYVINQEHAVMVVADALRRARSGVGSPNRPIGTFLFLGPTGVGKTELSKALARVYFGSESALIRLDMNQYVNSSDVNRLIQPMVGSELGFLGQVRKAPFSVILLDEIEKADKSVVNSLLQMLDEGEMRDSDNRAVSFKDAIIIATSNAGADKIRQIISNGEDIDKKEDEFIETLISEGYFAPEFLNRFDEVVIFKPLEQGELVQVIDIILADINKSLDSQKVQVELTNEAKKWLVEKGYDAKLGARPMRRMAQRYVENTVAKRLLKGSAGSGQTIVLDVADFEENKE